MHIVIHKACFTRITDSAITMDEAREYELSLSSTTQPTEGAVEPNDENRVLTFSELVELIETGNVNKIPNNKIIPEKLNVRRLFLFYSHFAS